MADIASPHDSFFRAVLADSRMALDYFKSTLPEPVTQLLDLTTLERAPDSYVSGELEKTMSDVVYRCRRSDGKGSVSVCLLVEHKSKPDKYTPVQVGGYLFSGYQQQIKQGHKELTTDNSRSYVPRAAEVGVLAAGAAFRRSRGRAAWISPEF